MISKQNLRKNFVQTIRTIRKTNNLLETSFLARGPQWPRFLFKRLQEVINCRIIFNRDRVTFQRRNALIYSYGLPQLLDHEFIMVQRIGYMHWKITSTDEPHHGITRIRISKKSFILPKELRVIYLAYDVVKHRIWTKLMLRDRRDF